MLVSNVDVMKLLLLANYREQREHVFPSKSSLDWFLRKHRAALVRAGALLLLTGRWFVDAPRFDAYLVEHGACTAAAHAALPHAQAQDKAG
jgi:hypothetical protein